MFVWKDYELCSVLILKTKSWAPNYLILSVSFAPGSSWWNLRSLVQNKVNPANLMSAHLCLAVFYIDPHFSYPNCCLENWFFALFFHDLFAKGSPTTFYVFCNYHTPVFHIQYNVQLAYYPLCGT